MAAILGIHQVCVFVLVGRISKSCILVPLDFMTLASVNPSWLDWRPLAWNGSHQSRKATEVFVNVLPSLEEFTDTHSSAQQMDFLTVVI